MKVKVVFLFSGSSSDSSSSSEDDAPVVEQKVARDRNVKDVKESADRDRRPARSVHDRLSAPVKEGT